MTAATRRESGAIAYDWFLSDDGTKCRLIEIYTGPAAVLTHLQGPVVTNLVPKQLENASIVGFTVYGDPGAEASKILAGFGAEILHRVVGLAI